MNPEKLVSKEVKVIAIVPGGAEAGGTALQTHYFRCRGRRAIHLLSVLVFMVGRKMPTESKRCKKKTPQPLF